MDFINFRIVDCGIEMAGTTLDLHDRLQLRRQSHDVEALRLELTFAGTTYIPTASPGVSGNAVDDEVTLIFEEVGYLRAQHSPHQKRPGDAPSLLEFVRFSECGEVLGDFAAHDERRDLSHAYYLCFTAGLELLVEAARVRAQWRRSARAE